MTSESSSLFRTLIGYLIVGTLIGLPFGHPALSALLATLIWFWKLNKQLVQLFRWAQHNIDIEPPELTGPVGDLTYRLSRQRKAQQTRLKRLNSAIHRFQQSASSMSDAIVIIDRNNELEWWNQAGHDLLGLIDEDRGNSVFNYFRDPRFVRFYRSSEQGEALQLKSTRDSDRIFEYRLHHFGDGDHVLVARDITEIHKLELMRRDFVSNASHELRTPLTVIHGYLETFLDSPLPAPLERPVDQMYQQSKRMTSLISDLLMLSKLENANEARNQDTISMRPLLVQIVEEAQALSGERNRRIELEISGEHNLKGEEREIYSAFSNLVFNAVRYTPKEGQIKIGWSDTAEGAELKVTDTGIGIPQSDIPRLTERFYRVDTGRSRESGGTGLGLAIVKHVLARHNAHLNIHSQLGTGSTFICSFPASRLN